MKFKESIHIVYAIVTRTYTVSKTVNSPIINKNDLYR